MISTLGLVLGYHLLGIKFSLLCFTCLYNALAYIFCLSLTFDMSGNTCLLLILSALRRMFLEESVHRNSPPHAAYAHTVHVHFITCKQTHVKQRRDLKCPCAGHVLPPPAFLYVAYILYCTHVFARGRVRGAHLERMQSPAMYDRYGAPCFDPGLLLHTLAKLQGLSCEGKGCKARPQKSKQVCAPTVADF